MENLDPAVIPDIFQKALLLVDQCLAISNTEQAGITFFRGVDEIKALCLKHISQGPPRSDLKPPVPSLSPPFQFGIHTLTRDNGQPQAFYNAGQRRYAQRTLALNALNQIISEFGQLPKTSTYPVRIILLASDAEIHTLANAYAVLRLEKDLDHLDFQFFPVPTSNPSSISLYLARRDPWYQRYLYNLSRCVAMITPRLLPSLDIPSDAQDWLGSGLSTSDLQTVNRALLNFIAEPLPSQPRPPYTQMTDFAHRHPSSLPPSPDLIFRSQIENYLREGSVTHRFLLWSCEVNFSDGQQNVVIVFHKSFHAGLSAATKAFKAKFDLGDETPDEEVQQSKAFKFVPPTFRISHNHTDLQGVNRPAPDFPPVAYQNISALCFDRSPHERSVTAHPHQAWFELLMIEPEPKKKSKSGPIIRNSHSSLLDITSPAPFDFLLDGVLYPPANSIKISPCVHNRTHIHLPVQTFFPYTD